MKIVKKESFGNHLVYNTNAENTHSYISNGGFINHNCVIDAGYRGICHVHLFNNGSYDQSFKAGEKVAQAIIVPVWDGQPELVEKVNENTERGAGGFGHTGA